MSSFYYYITVCHVSYSHDHLFILNSLHRQRLQLPDKQRSPGWRIRNIYFNLENTSTVHFRTPTFGFRQTQSSFSTNTLTSTIGIITPLPSPSLLSPAASTSTKIPTRTSPHSSALLSTYYKSSTTSCLSIFSGSRSISHSRTISGLYTTSSTHSISLPYASSSHHTISSSRTTSRPYTSYSSRTSSSTSPGGPPPGHGHHPGQGHHPPEQWHHSPGGPSTSPRSSSSHSTSTSSTISTPTPYVIFPKDGSNPQQNTAFMARLSALSQPNSIDPAYLGTGVAFWTANLTIINATEIRQDAFVSSAYI